MTIVCVVTSCRSQLGVLSENGQKISFHRFPKDDLREKWVKNIGRKEWRPSQYSRLCSLHFEQACYRDGFDRKILHSYAVPTVFPNNKNTKMEKNRKRRFLMHTSVSQEDVTPKIKRSRPCENQDLPSTSAETILECEKLKRQLAHCKMLAERRGRKLKILQRKHSRVIKKKTELEALLNDLKQQLECEQNNMSFIEKIYKSDF